MKTQTKLVLHKPYRAMDVANYLIEYFVKQDKPIVNLLLIKILYYLQADFLRQTKEPLFEDTIEKWGYGPMIPNVYSDFKSYGAAPITQSAEYVITNEDRSWTLIKPVNRTLDPADTSKIIALANEIYEQYHEHPFQIVEVTHREKLWQEDKAEIIKGHMHIPYDKQEMIAYFSDDDNWPWQN